MKVFEVQFKIEDWFTNQKIDFKIIGGLQDKGEKLMRVELNGKAFTTHPHFWIDLGKELIKHAKKHK